MKGKKKQKTSSQNLWEQAKKQAKKIPPLSKERKEFIEKEMSKACDIVFK